jgi:hypothetical protein
MTISSNHDARKSILELENRDLVGQVSKLQNTVELLQEQIMSMQEEKPASLQGE